MSTKNDNALVRLSLNQIINAKQFLRQLDVLRSERTTGEIGEWFVAELYGGTRAVSTTQPDWDIQTPTEKLQVKTHAKGEDNNARWTNVKATLKGFDYLIIVDFTSDLFLEAFYRIPIAEAQRAIRQSGASHIIKWDDVAAYKIDISGLPRQVDLVCFFLKK